MEKYAKLMKGLEICAGPDCSTECPYHGVHAAGRTCRSWLLSDAAAAIANEEAGSETLQELLHNTEAERDKLAADVDHLEAENNAYRTERDALREAYRELDAELHRTQQRETALLNGKTDRPSVSDDAPKNEYKRGYLDAMEYCFRELCKRAGGGCRHE